MWMFYNGVGVWLDVPSRLQLRVIRAFKSTLEDLEERRSCHSLHSLRISRSQQGNRPMSDISYIDEDSTKSPSPNSDKRCGSCNATVRLVTPVEESSPTTAETAPLVPPGSPPPGGPAAAATQQLGHHRPHTHANTQSTKCCHHHHHHHFAVTSPIPPLLQPLSPHHFNTLVAQTLHSNMAAHSSTLQPASPPAPPDIPTLVHETSIWPPPQDWLWFFPHDRFVKFPQLYPWVISLLRVWIDPLILCPSPRDFLAIWLGKS